MDPQSGQRKGESSRSGRAESKRSTVKDRENNHKGQNGDRAFAALVALAEEDGEGTAGGAEIKSEHARSRPVRQRKPPQQPKDAQPTPPPKDPKKRAPRRSTGKGKATLTVSSNPFIFDFILLEEPCNGQRVCPCDIGRIFR